MTDRLNWPDLPQKVRAAIEEQTGPAVRVEAVTSGRPGLAVRLYTERDEAFVKAIPLSDPAVSLIQRERWASLHLPLSAPVPRMTGDIIFGGWQVVMWELINDNADHAYMGPGSSDIPLVVDGLERLGKLLTPCPSRARPAVERVSSLWAKARFVLKRPVLYDRELYKMVLAGFQPSMLQGDPLLHGDQLLHGNLTPGHLRIKDGLLYVVDWSEACRGPAWFDLALLAPQLVVDGHKPELADAELAAMPGWREAPANHVAGLAALWTLARLYDAEHGPEIRRRAETRCAEKGKDWLAYRLSMI
ncbi:phosphotransferase [Nonomuraea sp. NPDC049784]|uniref:phosphotransferase n=1 Tax=Nonomuraea sp. NPDC049784 TaxID=3154361 RepID=UPI0033F82F09